MRDGPDRRARRAHWEAKAHFRLGQAAAAAGEPREAARAFRAAAAATLNSVESSALEREAGRLEAKAAATAAVAAARADLERARAAEEAEEAKQREQERQRREGEADARVGELQFAAEERDRPPGASEAAARAARAAQARDWDATEALFKQALALDPGFYQCLTRLALVHLAQRRDAAALACLRRAVRVEPGYLRAHVMAGEVLERQRQPKEAEQEYRAALEKSFECCEAWARLALCLYGQARRGEAVQLVKVALAGGPYGKFQKPGQDPQVRLAYAFLLAASGYLAEPTSVIMGLSTAAFSGFGAFLLERLLRLVGDAPQAAGAAKQFRAFAAENPEGFLAEMAWCNGAFDLPQWRRLEEDVDRALEGERAAANGGPLFEVDGGALRLQVLACVASVPGDAGRPCDAWVATNFTGHLPVGAEGAAGARVLSRAECEALDVTGACPAAESEAAAATAAGGRCAAWDAAWRAMAGTVARCLASAPARLTAREGDVNPGAVNSLRIPKVVAFTFGLDAESGRPVPLAFDRFPRLAAGESEAHAEVLRGTLRAVWELSLADPGAAPDAAAGGTHEFLERLQG